LIPVFIADAAANAILSVLLVPRFGIVGSALGTLIPQLVVTLRPEERELIVRSILRNRMLTYPNSGSSVVP
jgi:hypothetical protein